MAKRIAYLFGAIFLSPAVCRSDENQSPAVFTCSIQEGVHVQKLGIARTGQTANVEVKMNNDTTTVMRIREVEATCGCTRASVSSAEVMPKESVIVRVQISAPKVSGDFSTDLHLLTAKGSETVRTTLRFAMSAHTDAEWRLPSRVWKIDSRNTKESTYSLSLHGYHGTNTAKYSITAVPDVFDIARQPRASDGGESSIEVITLRLKENTISHPPLLRITASPISGDDGPSETQHIVLIKNSPINIFPTLISVQDLEEITVKAIISENLEGSELRLFARDESGSEILGQASQITKRLYSIRIPIKSVKGNKVFVSISQIGMEPLKEQEITLVRR